MDTRQLYLNDAKKLIKLAKDTTQFTYNDLFDAIVHIPNDWSEKLGMYTKNSHDEKIFTPVLPIDEEGVNIFTALVKNPHLTIKQKYSLFEQLHQKYYSNFAADLYSEDNLKILLSKPALLVKVYFLFPCNKAENIAIWKAIIEVEPRNNGLRIFQRFHRECMSTNEFEQGKGICGLFDGKGNAYKSGDVSKKILAAMMQYIQYWLGELKSPEDIISVTKAMIKHSTSHRTIEKYNGESNLSFNILKDYDFNSKVTKLAQLHLLKLAHKKLQESPTYLQSDSAKEVRNFLKKPFSVTSFFRCATTSAEHSPSEIYTLMVRCPQDSLIIERLQELEKSTEENLNQNINPRNEAGRPISLNPTSHAFFGQGVREHKEVKDVPQNATATLTYA